MDWRLLNGSVISSEVSLSIKRRFDLTVSDLPLSCRALDWIA
jgi:hypothetical protein